MVYPSNCLKVIPISKTGDDTMIENYRPISILPAISKILEKNMFNQLYNYFNTNKLFSKSQYGFRENHSTQYAALELINRIISSMDTGEIPFNIYIDLSKAFDTLDHSILVKKLDYYGVKDTALDLLAYVPVLRFFSTKAAELKCQNFTVKKVCQVEHFKTFRI